MMMASVSVSQELGFMCVKWKPVFNSNNALHIKINYFSRYSALVRNGRHKYADKNVFNTNITGLKKEKSFCYTNELLRLMIYVTFCAIKFGSGL